MEVGAGKGGLDLGQRPRQRRRPPRVVGADQLEPVRQRQARRLRKLVELRAGRGECAIQRRGFRQTPEPLEQLGLLQQGGSVIGIDRERAIEALHRAIEVAGRLQRLEVIEPDSG
jgi:hypothetical protein